MILGNHLDQIILNMYLGLSRIPPLYPQFCVVILSQQYKRTNAIKLIPKYELKSDHMKKQKYTSTIYADNKWHLINARGKLTF